MAAHYPTLPLFPNQRCGVWYVRPPRPDGDSASSSSSGGGEPRPTCYFKSTDGHNGNWGFSLVRLNLAFALAAARAGGCLVVDATKRGKVRRGGGWCWGEWPAGLSASSTLSLAACHQH